MSENIVKEPVVESEPLWTGQDMMDAMNARPVHGVAQRVEGISIDSRTIKPGEAFFAIKGDRFDGHDYAGVAAAKASVLVVSEAKLAALGRVTVPLLVVDDVLDALRRLARAARARTNARIIAITGSAGKTTTKDALRHALGDQGKIHASVASFNNHWGVPLTLARMPADTRFGIFEIGMNHAGEITPLVKLVRPHVSVITLIAGAHLGHFKNLDGIAHAKAEIFNGLVKGGTALINRDDRRFKLLSKLARDAGVEKIVGYGNNRQSDIKLKNAKYLPDCTCASLRVFDEDMAVKIGLPGKHIALNCLGVLAAVKLLGGDLAKAGHALASLQASDGRGRTYKLRGPDGTFTLIDESYNANPASMAVGLEMLGNAEPGRGGRRIAVLGDMLELGAHSKKLHKALADPVVQSQADLVYLAGEEMAALDDALREDVETIYHPETDELIKAFSSVPRAGDVIMIKSSNGIGLSRIVKQLLEKHGPPVE